MKSLSASLLLHGLFVAMLIVLLSLHASIINSYHIAAKKSIWVTVVKDIAPKRVVHLHKKGLQVIKKPKKKIVHHAKKTQHVIGQEAVKGKTLDRLVALLYEQIHAHYQPSSQASFMQQTGTTKVKFLLNPNGQAEHIVVVASSQFPLLDQAATAAVKRASPFQLGAVHMVKPQPFQIPVDFEG